MAYILAIIRDLQFLLLMLYERRHRPQTPFYLSLLYWIELDPEYCQILLGIKLITLHCMYLDASELRNILIQLPETLSDEEMDEMLRTGDTNGDGKFDLSELG